MNYDEKFEKEWEAAGEREKATSENMNSWALFTFSVLIPIGVVFTIVGGIALLVTWWRS